MTLRGQIVAKAREYLDVPFVHQGRDKHGLDCVGLVLTVAEDLGLRSKNGTPLTRDLYAVYASQPRGNAVHAACKAHLLYRSLHKIAPGDVLTMAVPNEPCHVAIVAPGSLGELNIIHAYAGGAQQVVEHALDYRWQRRIVGSFAFAGVD